MSNTFTMMSNYSTSTLSTSLYDSPALIGLDNCDNAVYVDTRGPKESDFCLSQGTTATGYNRNSIHSFSAINYNTYNMRWYHRSTIRNVTSFNKYIFENIRKIYKEVGYELSEYFDDSVFRNTMMAYDNTYQQNLTDLSKVPKGSYFEHPSYGNLHYSIMDFVYDDNNKEWMQNACELYLIGTPEDIEELSMFTGLIVREVSDKTHLFIKDATCVSILHTQNQLIEYRLDTYYAVVPNWWTSHKRLEDPTNLSGLHDRPYCECSDFQDPRLLETIEPSYEQQINPDERVYKIYIQMDYDLITTVYEKTNFFIGIRNSKKKMSIKNFMKYLS